MLRNSKEVISLASSEKHIPLIRSVHEITIYASTVESARQSLRFP